MSALVQSTPWWREPTRDQWYAWIAAWLGWTLDAFDFTMFLLIMVPISQEFGVPLTEVAFVLPLPCGYGSWARRVWLAGRSDRPQDAADDLDPLVFDLQLHRGLLAEFAFLFFFRALLGIGMGAEWPAGAALAMETWPARSRGFMSGMLQGSWSIGFFGPASTMAVVQRDRLAGIALIGILPALAVVYVRYFVKEPPVWQENRRRQRARSARCTLRCSPSSSRPDRQHIDSVLVDGQRLPGLLLDQRLVCGASAERPWNLSQALVATPIGVGEPRGISRAGLLGLVRRHDSAAAGR